MSRRRRYAVVGTGGRAVAYVDAIAGRFRAEAELVGLCDVSQTRMNWHNRRLLAMYGAGSVPTYAADRFDAMVREGRPDAIIVTSVDATHHDYIIRAAELGCDSICEKPLTIDAPKLKSVLQTLKRTGRSLRVTFNYRYAPHVSKVRALMQQGVVGAPLAVDLSWVLDTSHGADYFRRWHREKDQSGGLLVHKASHHFDLVNWWIDSFPQRVFALGELKFYGRRNAETRGESYPYDRYTGAPAAAGDPFALTLDGHSGDTDDVYGGATLKGLYLDAEVESGYVRDRNVFGDNISAEDTMAVTARYHNGVILNYSLIAYCPWEGFRVAITGTKGRLELYERTNSHIITGESDTAGARRAKGPETSLRVFPMFQEPYDVPVPPAEGGHGGADPLMLEQIFSASPPPDPLDRAASHIDGAAAVLLGISANESIQTGLPVDCDNLLKLPSRGSDAPPRRAV